MFKNLFLLSMLTTSVIAATEVYVLGDHGDDDSTAEYIMRIPDSNCYFVGRYDKAQSQIVVRVKSCLFESHAKTEPVLMSAKVSLPLKHGQKFTLLEIE